jgi:hypothetical protein
MQKNRKHLTQTQGFDLVKTFMASGLMPRKFCTQTNILLGTLAYWRTKYKKQRLPRMPQPPVFVPLTVLPEQPQKLQSCAFKIFLRSGISIEVNPGFDRETFKQIMDVCQTCG